jgi:hypothetical protein
MLTGTDALGSSVSLTTTDASGFYTFTGLQAGTYTIITASGARTCRRGCSGRA